MAINFIPNDPNAASPAMRTQTAHRSPSASRAGFSFVNPVSQRLYNPGTPEFLYWQCREAALMTLKMWESLDGKLTAWARANPNLKKLLLVQNGGQELNAYYDGDSLAFFEFTTGTKTTFSGASTDVVAHEVGHALLDTIRPDLWDSNLTEPNAFHEAFGDCVAILTALFDRETRKALLAHSPDLSNPNFVEGTAEDLSDGVRRQFGANHPAAAPRRALNNFKWQLPTTLPPHAPPAQLSSEIHSFGRVFSGCFYDVIRNIFASSPSKNEAALLSAAQIAGKLLIGGTKSAPETPRFFQAVGRAMGMNDQTQFGGVHQMAIRDAFARHNIQLGTEAMLMPRATLAGAVSKAKTETSLSLATRNDLKQRIGANSKAKLTIKTIQMGSERLTEVVHHREISLTGLSERLKGVVAVAAEPILVGNASGRAALLSMLPESNTTTDEVHAFVESLLKNNQIDFTSKKHSAKGKAKQAIATVPTPSTQSPTHMIRTRSGKQVLQRVRFVCGCGCKCS